MTCEACGNSPFHSHAVTGDTWVDLCSRCQRDLRRHLRDHHELLVRQQVLANKVRQSQFPSSTGISEGTEQLYSEYLHALETIDQVVEEWLEEKNDN